MLAKFNKNKFSKSRFSNEKHDIINKDEYVITEFNGGLISKDLPPLYFTNYAESELDAGYNIMMDYYIRYLDGDTSFIDDFYFDEEGISKGYRAERLLKIIKSIRNIKYTSKDYPFILKMNHKHNDTLRLFWSHHNNNLKLLIVDLYHLGIYGKPNNKPVPIQKLYKSKKNNTVSLERIKQL